MTTSEQSTALATRQLTDRQIQTRIELNKQAGYGLEKASPPQLNLIFLYCQKYQLLPGDDVTLYENKPWLTLLGTVKLMRRHDEYRGFDCKPLSAAAKQEWGYDSEDIVVECQIRTATWGTISARGKVSKEEIAGIKIEGRRLNYVAGIHPVEMAEKRAIQRAERLAFGADAMIDEDELAEVARTVIEERTQPTTVAANAKKYDQIYGSAYPDEQGSQPRQAEPEEHAEHLDYAPTQSELYDTYRQQLRAAKEEMGDALDASKWVLRSDTSIADIEAKGKHLATEVECFRERMKAPEAESPKAHALSRNKNLLDEAQQYRIPGLGKYKCDDTWPLDRIEAANTALGDRIKERNGDAETAAKQDQVL